MNAVLLQWDVERFSLKYLYKYSVQRLKEALMRCSMERDQLLQDTQPE